MSASAVSNVVIGGFGGNSVDTQPGGHGGDAADSCIKSTKIEVLGDTEYLGIPCKHVRFSVSKMEPFVKAHGLGWDQFIAVEPTIRLLKTFNLVFKPEQEDLAKWMESDREIKELKVIDGRLFATAVDRYHRGKDGRLLMEYGEKKLLGRVKIVSVEPLPTDYPGLWELNWDGPTGTLFSGPAESAVRHLGNHIDDEKVLRRFVHESMIDEYSWVPFDDAEEEKIREYLVAKKFPVSAPKVSWSRLIFYAINLLAIGCLGWVFWRRARAEG